MLAQTVSNGLYWRHSQRTGRNEMTAKHTSYANGAIRNASGVLVAFYDAEEKQLSINGFVQTFYAPTLLDAMEIVGSRCA